MAAWAVVLTIADDPPHVLVELHVRRRERMSVGSECGRPQPAERPASEHDSALLDSTISPRGRDVLTLDEVYHVVVQFLGAASDELSGLITN